MKTVAQVISWAFMPLLMPIYALILTMYVPSSQIELYDDNCLHAIRGEGKLTILYMFIIFCVIAPGVSFLLLLRQNIVSSIEMDDKKDRIFPIIIMMVYCLLLYGLLAMKTNEGDLPKYIFGLLMAGSGVTFIFIFLNRWKKISIHAAGAGILTGFILAYILQHAVYELWVFTLAIIISGLVLSARLYLQKHTFFEVIVGWLTGTLITFGVNYFY